MAFSVAAYPLQSCMQAARDIAHWLVFFTGVNPAISAWSTHLLTLTSASGYSLQAARYASTNPTRFSYVPHPFAGLKVR